MMDAKEWDKLKSIFQAALELAPEKRPAFLDEQLGADTETRREIDTLLQAYEQSDEFFAQPAAQKLAPLIAPHTEMLERIGPYRLLRELGRGGMGLVYLAMRDDEVAQKHVAIKLLRPGPDTEAISRRFSNERQTLASLEHPNIAQFLDGGVTSDGRPYYVMEYVEGEPIDRYCNNRRLTIRERLDLFRKVCAAVQVAHQNFVVHRDLKPDNILVTNKGEPKLLDFGIAKILNREMVGGATVHTLNLLLMTPEYASPEQVRSGKITTASDVYALGILLFELLTGRRAYETRGLSPAEIERVICEQMPEKPSAVVTLPLDVKRSVDASQRSPEAWPKMTRTPSFAKLQRRLSGDLDNILFKAIRKEPERRYASVEQFADDIQRHLDGKPVSARKDSLRYRFGKFVLRHRVGVATAALMLLLVLGSVVTIAWQARQTAAQRDIAQAEAAKAKHINEFLQNMLASADPNKEGREVRVVDVLAAAEERIDDELGHQPEIAAALHATIGVTYQHLGLFEKAEPHLRTALNLRQKWFQPPHAEIAASMQQLGALLYKMGKYEESESHLRRALAMHRHLDEPDSLSLAKILDGLGGALDARDRLGEAEAYYREALAMYRSVLEEPDPQLGQVLNNLAVLLGTRGDFREAEPLHREALEIARKVHGEEHPQVAWMLYNLGGVLDAQGKYDRSVPLVQQALEMWRKLLGETHPNVVMGLATLSSTHWLIHDYEKAQAFAAEALSIAKGALPADHPLTAYAHITFGMALCDGGEPQQGERHLRTALRMRQEGLPPDHHLVLNTKSALGDCLVMQGRFQEAEPLLLESYEKLKTKFGSDHEKTVAALERIVALYDKSGKSDKEARYRALLTNNITNKE